MTDTAVGLFSKFQPIYAEHRIATFPVEITPQDDGRFRKVPLIQAWGQVGLGGSAELAQKRSFRDVNAFGFVCGRRSRISMVDVDSTDERLVADALATYGQTPVISRTATGKHHLWYRYGGEARRIRPIEGSPIDILGGGVAVAPPSIAPCRAYEFIQGGLDDLDRLPRIKRDAPAIAPAAREGVLRQVDAKDQVHPGQRDNALFDHCLSRAKGCRRFDELLAIAASFNETYCVPPLPGAEVKKAAGSAWKITEEGRNRKGEHGAWFPIAEVNELLSDQDALILLAFLRANQGPNSTFMCANGLAETLGWRRQRLAGTRRRLIGLGYLVPLRTASPGEAALFRWGAKGKGGQKWTPILNVHPSLLSLPLSPIPLSNSKINRAVLAFK